MKLRLSILAGLIPLTGLVAGCSAGSVQADAAVDPADPVAGREDPTGPVAGEPADRLQVGVCLRGVIIDRARPGDPVTCDASHRKEIYHRFELPAGDYPGDSVVEATAEQGCLDAFAGFVGISYADSVYGYTTLWPTQTGWDERNDRTVLCLIGNYDRSDKTGTARGTAI